MEVGDNDYDDDSGVCVSVCVCVCVILMHLSLSCSQSLSHTQAQAYMPLLCNSGVLFHSIVGRSMYHRPPLISLVMAYQTKIQDEIIPEVKQSGISLIRSLSHSLSLSLSLYVHLVNKFIWNTFIFQVLMFIWPT